MNPRLRNWLLIVILVIAAGIRFYRLGLVPPSPDWDEVSLGYNAYSVLKTGRDEYGVRFPVVLRSYDDYKPPLYTYLAIPPVAAFGLTVWAVRFPSATAGVLSVLGVFLLVRELAAIGEHQQNRRVSREADGDDQLIVRFWDHTALLAAFLLAISPWNIQFSRIAFEANIGVTLNLWAMVCFFKGLRQRRLLSVSAILFGLNFYTYQSERLFVPLLALLLFFLFRKQLLSDKKSFIAAAVLGTVVMLPFLSLLTDPVTLMRLKGTSSLSDTTQLLSDSVSKLERDRANGDRLGMILDNRRFVYARTVISGYVSHFSVKWLFLTGDLERHHAPDNGLMYIWELPFLVWGIYDIWKRKGRLRTLLFSWLLLAPVPAAPTSGVPHAIRSMNVLPLPQILVATGLLGAYQFYSSHRQRIVSVATAVYIMFALFVTVRYFDLYFLHTNNEFSEWWQYGYKQAVAYADTHAASYDRIVVSTKLEQPYMFFLFYLRYDPAGIWLPAGLLPAVLRRPETVSVSMHLDPLPGRMKYTTVIYYI